MLSAFKLSPNTLRATSALALLSTRTHAAESSIVLVAADKLPVLAKALTKVGPSVFLC